MQKNLLQAIDLALSGQWNAAHQIVQQYEDTTASWIHAVLHKIEGDQDNSQYWYRCAGKLEHSSDEPKAELAEIRKEVAGGDGAGCQTKWLTGSAVLCIENWIAAQPACPS